MSRELPWERTENETFASVMGYQFWATLDDNEWLSSIVCFDQEIMAWNGVSTRAEAEEILQSEFDHRIAYWSGLDVPLPLFGWEEPPHKAGEK